MFIAVSLTWKLFAPLGAKSAERLKAPDSTTMLEAINISHRRCEAIRITTAMKRLYGVLFNCFMYSTSAFACSALIPFSP
jgi:hypothetical protein